MARSASATAPVSCAIDPTMVLSHKFPEVTDEALYALAVGACNADAADEKELQLVYHRDDQSSIKILPTFISALNAKTGDGFYMDVPGLHYDPTLLLHGQQYIEIYKLIPSQDNIADGKFF
ncbi:Enoyl-CoA hydratase 2, peroxisomal [Zea mays]|uniref:Enoyl-CoA hydratase 2, peroxisomal n=1 Tax=Zea mays TaxID=4577 RepID=A0A3L6EWT1_MAIZE|nr:Enoyl-CoA hydratase 2, peroxisomal [Zea mays]